MLKWLNERVDEMLIACFTCVGLVLGVGGGYLVIQGFRVRQEPPVVQIVTLYSPSGEKLLELTGVRVFRNHGGASITDTNGKNWELTGTIIIRPADAPMP